MENEVDIASGSFIERWPHWIRWVLFLPAAILGSLLGTALFRFSQTFTNGEVTNLVELMSSGILGASFVFLGCWMAPRYQFGISIFLLIIATIISVLAFQGNFYFESGSWFLYLLHSAAVLIGASIVVFYVKNEVK